LIGLLNNPLQGSVGQVVGFKTSANGLPQAQLLFENKKTQVFRLKELVKEATCEENEAQSLQDGAAPSQAEQGNATSPGGRPVPGARKLTETDRAQMNTSRGAKNEVDVELDEFHIRISPDMVRNLSGMQHWYTNIERWKKFLPYRPTQANVVGAAKMWWQYAVKCVMSENENIVSVVVRLIKLCREYSELFKRKFADGRPWLQPLSESDAQRCVKLEEELPMQVITNRRKQAWLQLHQEEQGNDHGKRDYFEMQSELLGIAADSWTDSPTDTIVDSRWLLSERSETKAPKKQWLMIVDAQRFVSTTFSGWAMLRHEKKKDKWDRFWFRLKGETLTIFAYPDDKTPKRHVSIRQCLSIEAIETYDTKFLKIEAEKKEIFIKCDTAQESESWLAHLAAIVGNANYVPTIRAHRWLIIYKTPTDSKPVDAIPLVKGTYTMTKRELKKAPFAVVIAATLLDFSLKERLISADSPEELTQWSAILSPDSAEVAHTIDKKALAASQTMSAHQQALILGEVSMDDLNDDEPDDEEDEPDTSALVLQADYCVSRVGLKVSGIKLTFSGGVYDWVTVNLQDLTSMTSRTACGVRYIEFKMQDAVVHDCYTRDTCYPRLLFRTQLGELPILKLHASIRSVRDSTKNTQAQGETHIQIAMQPVHLVCNPFLIPALKGFANLRDDDGVVDVKQHIENKLIAIRESMSAYLVDTIGATAEQLQTKKRRLHLTIEVGSMHVILPSVLHPTGGSAPAVVVAFESFSVLSAKADSSRDVQDAATLKNFDEFRALLKCMEVYCCDGPQFMRFHHSDHGCNTKSGAVSPSSKRHLLRSITLPACLRVDTFVRAGNAVDVDRVSIELDVQTLRLQLTTAALRECGSVLFTAATTVRTQHKATSHLFGSTLAEKTSTQITASEAIKEALRTELSDTVHPQAEVHATGWIDSPNTKPATRRFELCIGAVAISIEDSGAPPTRNTLRRNAMVSLEEQESSKDSGRGEQIAFMQANGIKCCFTSRKHVETWVSGSIASLHMQSGHRRFENHLSMGVANLASKFDDSRSRWFVYKTADSSRLLPYYGLPDLTQVLSQNDLRSLIPLLRHSTQVTKLVQLLLRSFGIRDTAFLPTNWQQSLTALEDAFDGQLNSSSERSYVLQNVAQRMLGEKWDAIQSMSSALNGMGIGVDGIFATPKGAIDTAREIMCDAAADGKSLVEGALDAAKESLESASEGTKQLAEKYAKAKLDAVSSLVAERYAGGSAAASAVVQSTLGTVSKLIASANMDILSKEGLHEQLIAPLLTQVDSIIEERALSLRSKVQTAAEVSADVLASGMRMVAHRSDVVALLNRLGYHDTGDDYIDGLMNQFADTDSENGSALSLEALQLVTRFLNGEMQPVEHASETNHDKAQSVESPPDGPDPDSDTEDDVSLYSGMYYVDEDRRVSDEIDITAAVLLVENGTIDDHTLVFADGMQNWTPFQDCKHKFDW
jgi:hypothetical protein